MIVIDNFINGAFRKAKDYLPVYNPANGTVYAQVADSHTSDLDEAVKAAHDAFSGWSGASIDYRSGVLNKLAQLIEDNLDKLAEAESLDNGKPVFLAKKMDIPRAALNLRFYASAIVNESSEAHIEGPILNYTRRSPLGIVGCISPWNLPLYLLTWKIAPALAVGNCVIAKPSEITPYTAFLFCQLAKEAGLPDGVLNVLHGAGAGIGQAIVKHSEVKAISFTGSTATGRIISQIAAAQFKKVSLELGGKNPVVVFDDCDFERAVRTSVRGAFTNQGEICLCGSRILVQRDLYERFKEAFVKQVRKLKVGRPGENFDLGAIVSLQHLEKIHSHVIQAIEDGGKVLMGGNRVQLDNGYYFEPTVIEGLDTSCRINQEEVFGPVVTLIPFSDPKDAVRKANSTAYGLAAVIWTEDIDKAHGVAHQLQSGIVWINNWMTRDLRTPFGGIKQSGMGREGGSEALRFFTDPQNICLLIREDRK